MASFRIIGPIDIPLEVVGRNRIRRVDKDLNGFWSELRDVANKVGCYVFARKYGTGYQPVYVGKTLRTFKSECFHSHKLVKYNDAIARNPGKPVIFFVYTNGKPSKAKSTQIEEMETFLIGVGRSKNPELANITKCRPPEWSIEGVVRGRQGRTAKAPREFKKMIGIP